MPGPHCAGQNFAVVVHACCDERLTSQLVSYNLRLVHTYGQSKLDALGDGTRRAILARLLGGPLPVVEIARDLPVSRPAISQHLRILKQANLVVDQAVGTRRVTG